MAIVLPVLLLVLFGIIDFGLMLNRQLLLTEAAREGARVAALNGTESAVRDRVRSVLGTDPTTAGITTCSPTSTQTSAARVELSFSYDTKTPLGSMMLLFGQSSRDTFRLTSTGVMTCVG
jgi:Flp pilus assembly protein TadG